MEAQPLVSVLMTAYNREKYIGEAIESVLASDYSNFELIIVDDGSRDNTVSIAKAYAAKDSRVKLFINEKNLGDYPNRNRSAALAAGKYLKYVDSDDKIYPGTLGTMVSAMELYPTAGLGIASRTMDQVSRFPDFLQPRESYLQHFFIDGFLENGPLALIIRRDVFNKCGCFSGKRMVGDMELWLRIAAEYPLVRLQKGLVFWRQHDGQEFQKGFSHYLIEGSRVTVAALKSEHSPLSKDEINKVIEIRGKRCRQLLYKHLLKSGRLKQFLSMYRDLRKIYSSVDYVAAG